MKGGLVLGSSGPSAPLPGLVVGPLTGPSLPFEKAPLPPPSKNDLRKTNPEELFSR